MKYLLDTHILLWWLANEQKKLSKDIIKAIFQPENYIFVSVASLWEITIKKNLGKLHIPNDLLNQLKQQHIDVLDINAQHVFELDKLEQHHADPFDRMLIAQAKSDSLTLISADKKIHTYNVTVLKP